ncbi:MAG: hypothetical protein HFI84_07245 [Eubacterium sp.]|nr:hypothetical protein [Eubacterium sp.]
MKRKCCCSRRCPNRCCRFFYKNRRIPDKLKCIRRSLRELIALLNCR